VNDLAALAYADIRSAVNTARTIWRTPARLVPWLLFGIGLPVLFYARVRFMGHAQTGDLTTHLDAIVIVPVIMFAVLLITNARVGLFAGRAEARFVSLSPLPHALTVAYLQMRTITTDAVRLTLSTVYLLFVFLPQTIGGAQFVRDIAFAPLVLIAFGSLLLPRRLAPPAAVAGFIATAVLAIAVGAALLVRNAIGQAAPEMIAFLPFSARLQAAALRIPAWHPGRLLIDPNASTIGLFVIALVAATAVALLARTARDAFPELYDLSQARIELRERLRKRVLFTVPGDAPGAADKRPRTIHADSGFVPGGVGVLGWKAWIEFRRSSSVQTRAIGIIALLALGFLAAYVDRVAPAVVPGALGSASFVFIAIGLGSAQRLGGELRRPLFHLASPTLFERLAMMTIAQAGVSWIRGGFVVIGALLGGIDPRIAASALLIMFCLFTLLVAAGFALFSLWPDAIDRRGPLALVRTLALLVIVGIGAAAGTVIWLILSPLAGIVSGCAIAVASTLALLGLATWRISGQIDLLSLEIAAT